MIKKIIFSKLIIWLMKHYYHAFLDCIFIYFIIISPILNLRNFRERKEILYIIVKMFSKIIVLIRGIHKIQKPQCYLFKICIIMLYYFFFKQKKWIFLEEEGGSFQLSVKTIFFDKNFRNFLSWNFCFKNATV